jgi:tetratricopeptide (TPR) repeat protein
MSGTLEYGWAPLTGVLLGRDKYIDLPIPELYDLGHDQSEQNNLMPGAADRGRVLAARLAAFNAPRPGTPREETPDAAAQLRSLGYASGGAAPKARYTEDDDPKRLAGLDRLMHDAVERGEAGGLNDAIGLYRRVLAERPDMLAASRHLAFAYWRLGNANAAIETLRTALRQPGVTPAARIQLGVYLVETGKQADGLAQLEASAAADPNVDALDALGLAYARIGRAADAMSAFNRVLALEPGHSATYENVGALYLDGARLEEARQAFTRALELNSGSSSAETGLAMVASRRGDRKEAITHWKRAVDLQPSNFDALYDLGMTLANDGQTASARRYLEQFVRTAPRAQYGQEIQRGAGLLRSFTVLP